MNKAGNMKTADNAGTHSGLYSALASAQAEMGRVIKDTPNEFFKTKYADLASVMDACMPSLNKHGIAVLQPAYDDETGRYVKTILVHGASGEMAECRVPLIVSKNDMQGYGSAVTYARRYGLMSMAGVAADDDDGNAAAKSPPKQEHRPSGPPKEAVEGAADSLKAAETLDQLKAIWSELPKPVQSVAAVIQAKDGRKADLDKASEQKPAQSSEELLNDHIPHQR